MEQFADSRLDHILSGMLTILFLYKKEQQHLQTLSMFANLTLNWTAGVNNATYLEKILSPNYSFLSLQGSCKGALLTNHGIILFGRGFQRFPGWTTCWKQGQLQRQSLFHSSFEYWLLHLQGHAGDSHLAFPPGPDNFACKAAPQPVSSSMVAPSYSKAGPGLCFGWDDLHEGC